MEKLLLEQLVSQKLTSRAIAKATSVSQPTVLYYLKKYQLQTLTSKKRRSWTDEQFLKVLPGATSISDVITRLGLKPKTAHYNTVKKAAKKLGVELPSYDYVKGNANPIYTDEQVFVVSSPATGANAKARLLKKGYGTECEICKQPNVWFGKPLTMVLDHINGVNDDHRIENLRFVCPNCNSTLPTHCKGSKDMVVVAQSEER